MSRLFPAVVASFLLSVTLSSCGSSEGGAAATRSRLDIVKDRGKLVCGVSGKLPGFSYVDEAGNYSGMDVDVCRAIASAIFNDPNAVEYRELNAKERFTAVQSGQVDVLSRNTTWTINRDTTAGLEFAPVVFYDGQGIMVKQDSGIETLEDLQGKSICVQTGTTTEQNLADQMGKREISYSPLVFEDADITFATYAEGRCEAVTTDRSQLVSRRSILPEPDNHVILEETLSKEPLAPAVTNGDSPWFDVVKWSVYSLINAEELGVTSDNVEKLAQTSENPEVARFLGTEGDLGTGLGLSNDFTVNVIKNVGNYGEIYERHLGENTEFNLPRGQNALWTEGGLLYSPPFR
jgi:general L-amino acid transport system substrate-binding protein